MMSENDLRDSIRKLEKINKDLAETNKVLTEMVRDLIKKIDCEENIKYPFYPHVYYKITNDEDINQHTTKYDINLTEEE